MNKIYTLSFSLFFILLIVSCKKDIEIKVPETASEIVVEGWIEQDQFPIVYLTKSFPFFSKIDSASLFEQIVSEAKVTVSCENESEILTLRRDESHYPPYYYIGTEMKGKVGKRYDLKVEISGKIITSSSVIEKVPYFDKLYYQPENPGDTIGHLYFEIMDDPAAKNYYRTFTMIKHKENRYYPTLLNSYDDQYYNGEKINFNLYKGYKSISDYTKNDIYFIRGDTINVRFCSVEREQFDFWNSYQGKALNITSFASSPNKIKSNIIGGLGIWGGYGASYYQIIAK